MKHASLVGVAAGALAVAAAACSSSPGSSSDASVESTAPCVAGQSVACVGVGACAGGQVCAADGKSFGPCLCGSTDVTVGDGAQLRDANQEADAIEASDAYSDASPRPEAG